MIFPNRFVPGPIEKCFGNPAIVILAECGGYAPPTPDQLNIPNIQPVLLISHWSEVSPMTLILTDLQSWSEADFRGKYWYPEKSKLIAQLDIKDNKSPLTTGDQSRIVEAAQRFFFQKSRK